MSKKSIKRHLAAACLLGLGALSLNAQTSLTLDSKGDSGPSTTDTHSTDAFYHPFSISAELGTTGAGGSFGWRFSDLLGVHAGMDYFNWSGSRKVQRLSPTPASRLSCFPRRWRWTFTRGNGTPSMSAWGIMVDQSEILGSAGGAYALNGRVYTGSRI